MSERMNHREESSALGFDDFGARVRVRSTGELGTIDVIERDATPVFRGGLLPDVFPGPVGFAGVDLGPLRFVVALDDGGRVECDGLELERA